MVAESCGHPDLGDCGAQVNFIPQDGAGVGAFEDLGVFQCSNFQAAFAGITNLGQGFDEGFSNFCLLEIFGNSHGGFANLGNGFAGFTNGTSSGLFGGFKGNDVGYEHHHGEDDHHDGPAPGGCGAGSGLRLRFRLGVFRFHVITLSSFANFGEICVTGLMRSRLYRYDHGQEFFRPETSAGVYSHGVIGGHCLGGHFVFHDGTSVGPSQR